MSHASNFNTSNCMHCPKTYSDLGTYNVGKVGTINEPKLGTFFVPQYGGVGYSSKTKAYQNEGGYATLTQAYPAFPTCMGYTPTSSCSQCN